MRFRACLKTPASDFPIFGGRAPFSGALAHLVRHLVPSAVSARAIGMNTIIIGWPHLHGLWDRLHKPHGACTMQQFMWQVEINGVAQSLQYDRLKICLDTAVRCFFIMSRHLSSPGGRNSSYSSVLPNGSLCMQHGICVWSTHEMICHHPIRSGFACTIISRLCKWYARLYTAVQSCQQHCRR